MEKRADKSLLEHSGQKASKIINKHNYDVNQRKNTVSFETILRDRHIQHKDRIGTDKGIPVPGLKGLKGRGKSSGSLFEKVFSVEEVYKFDK